VPGKKDTLWDGGVFKLDVTFPDGKWLRIPCDDPRTDTDVLCASRIPNQASKMYVLTTVTIGC